MRSAGVDGIANIAPFFLAAQRRRVDIIGIFDSNGAQNGITGHFEGQAMAAATIFGAYGSGFIPGSPPTHLTVDQAGHTGGSVAAASPDADFTAIKFPAVSAASGGAGAFGNFDWGGVYAGNSANGGFIQLQCRFPVDLNGKIGYCPVFWRPQTGGLTQIIPAALGWTNSGAGPGQGQLSSTTLALSAVPADGISEEKWVIARGSLIDLTNATNPANSAANYKGAGLRFIPRAYTGTGTGADGTNVGGMIGSRITDEEMFHGIAYSPFYVLGGYPTRAVALDICGVSGTDAAPSTPIGGMTDAALGAYLKGLAKAQRDSAGNQLAPMLLVQMIEGGNDAGDTTTIGSSGLTSGKSISSASGAYQSGAEISNAGNTELGYFANTTTVLRRIRYVWETVLGYDGANLFFLIGCYHPQPSGISSAQWTFVRTTMVTAMATVVASERNVCAVDGYKLGNYAEFGRVTGNTSGGSEWTNYLSALGGNVYNSITSATADKGTWADATAYIVGDQVTYSNIRYLCIVAHTSATADNRPSTGSTYLTKWVVLTGAQAWYRDPSNQTAHLNQQGYLAWGIRVWGAIRAALAEEQSPGFNGRAGRTIFVPIPI